MIVESTPLVDAYVLTPQVFKDQRGYFFESFNDQKWNEAGLKPYNWVQENESMSSKGVLRGMHFQKGDAAQAKLVRVIKGEVFDVALDLRKDSKSFGKWFGVVLSETNKKQFLVPKGFAHGFLVLSETAVFSYKCDNYYSPEQDSGVMYNDKSLNIKWPELNVDYLISNKDQNLDSFNECYRFN